MLEYHLGEYVLSQEYVLKVPLPRNAKCVLREKFSSPASVFLSEAQIRASFKKFPCEKLQIILNY